MTIWEISEKADYIAERHRRLQDQWRIYCNSLVQGITLSKARLHHAMSCAPDKDLCFVLFEHFTIYVTLADGFNSHTIEYYVETKDGDDKQLIAQAELTIDGKVDERISNRDREQVLEHYLEHAREAGFGVLGLTYSPIRGPEGNIEYLGYLRHGQGTPGVFSLPEIVEASHSQLKD